jgi:hypothetical protein
MNGKTVPRMTNRHMITVRDIPVPSITIVWTGITAEGGITIAMIASKITPPAAPVKTPMKAVTNDAKERAAKRGAPTSADDRISIRSGIDRIRLRSEPGVRRRRMDRLQYGRTAASARGALSPYKRSVNCYPRVKAGWSGMPAWRS